MEFKFRLCHFVKTFLTVILIGSGPLAWLWENRAIVKRAKRLSRGNIHFAINLDLMKNTTFLSGWIAKTVRDFLAFFYQQSCPVDTIQEFSFIDPYFRLIIA